MILTLRKALPETELNELLDKFLQQAMMMNHTNASTLQLLNEENNTLELVATSGLSSEFADHFKTVTIDDGSVCARALETGATIFIEDLTKDKEFSRHLNLALQNNIIAVQSTPLISSSKKIIGMISTHFRVVKKPSANTLANFESFCRKAADKIEELTKA